jgi:hypothetical protein
MDDNISLDIQHMDVVDDKMSTGKRYMDNVDEIFIYDDCASLPNYIMCAVGREPCWQQLRRVRSSLLELSLRSALLLHTDFSIVGVSLWRAFVGFLSLFSLEVRAFRVAKGVFFFCFGKEYCVLGASGSEEGAEGTEEGRLSIRFLTRPSARVLRLEAGRRWREPCCGLRCWRFCWFV